MGTHIHILGYIRYAKNLRILGTGAFCLFLLLSLLTIFPIVKHTDDAEAAYTPSTSTVTITSASNIASVDITPNSAAGTFVSSATAGSEVTFGVTTDNLTGYTIAVAARSGDTSGQLTNASYSDTLDTIASPVNETTFANDTTGTYTNKWGLKSSKYNTSTSTWDPLASGNYIPAPKTSDVVLDTTTSSNSTPIQYRVGIGAKVDYEKAAGTYTNTYILQAVGNQISYQITYSDTTGDTAVTPTLPSADGANDIEAAGFTLSSTTPTRTGYTFAGWCDGTVTHVASGNSTCAPNTTTGAPGTTYAAGASYSFSSLSSSSINSAILYAMWNVNTYSLTIAFGNSYVTSVSVRSGSTSGTIIKTVNSSDSNKTVTGLTYGVTYYLTPAYSSTYRYSSSSLSGSGTLSWPNFTVGAGDATVSVSGKATTFDMAYSEAGKSPDSSYYKMQEMTSSICSAVTDGQTATLRDRRTNDNRTYTVAKFLNMCWMTSNLDLPGNITIYNTDSNLNSSLTSYKLPASEKSSSSFSNDSTAYVYNSGRTNCGPSPECYSYYSWRAAAAGTNSSSGEATSDICPKGWRLPTQAESTTLINTYTTGATLTAAPFLGVYSGYGTGSTFVNVGSAGYYWLSTAGGASEAYTLYFYRSSTNVYNGAKRSGHAVRCVANS